MVKSNIKIKEQLKHSNPLATLKHLTQLTNITDIYKTTIPFKCS